MHSPLWVLYGLIGFLGVLPSVAGSVVCLLHLERSRWVALMAAGFGFHAAASILQRLGPVALGARLAGSADGMGLLFAVASAFLLVADAAVVCGLAGLLAELRSSERRSAGRSAAPPEAPAS